MQAYEILLYDRIKEPNYITKPVRVLRGNVKVKFELMARCAGKYLNSPLYRGSNPWSITPSNIQRSAAMNVFTKHVSE